MRVRAPAVAGTFYPADPDQLEAFVSAMLAEGVSEPGATAQPIKALIVPHAGYVYSGPVAASAYACLGGLRGRIDRVVLLGPAHRVAVRGLAVPDFDAFGTPLGSVPVDREAIAGLLDLEQVGLSNRAHADEHSLEVQLPFLKCALGDFSLVPLVVGDASDEDVAEVLERLWGGPETLIVISSDLSHYHDYETAVRLDEATGKAIEALDAESLDWESACGRVPVRGLLRAARRHGLEPHTLDLRSSGDTAGDRDRVVGYGAWSFRLAQGAASERDGDGSDATTPNEDSLLLDAARSSIAQGLESGQPAGVDASRYPAALREKGASFVTLRSPSGELRGCIGSLEPQRSLIDDVTHNAFAAAFRDSRMQPISRAELDALQIEISILGPRQEIRAHSFEDLLARLRPGRDGLVLEDLGRRATFLPQVWSQLADPRAFVGALWQKAGWSADHWSETARAWRYEVRSIEEP